MPFIERDWGRVHYELEGEGPPLFLLIGGGGEKKTLRLVARHADIWHTFGAPAIVARKAGFQLADRSEINANPKDSKDHPFGVWTLPPTYELKDKDKAKYAEIGESDRMTLRFVKPKAAKKK